MKRLSDHYQQNLTRSGGFTLMEVLIVMIIIGILAVLGFGNFQSSQIKSRDAKRKADLAQVTRALELYYNDKGSYPLSNGAGEMIGCGPAGSKIACEWGEAFQEPVTGQATTVYMVELPEDPKSPTTGYYYYTDGAGDYYQLYARLENQYDGDLERDAEDTVQVFSGTLCGSVSCNWGISSSNSTPEDGRTLVDG